MKAVLTSFTVVLEVLVVPTNCVGGGRVTEALRDELCSNNHVKFGFQHYHDYNHPPPLDVCLLPFGLSYLQDCKDAVVGA